MKCPSGAPCLTFGISSRRDFEELDSSAAPSCFLGLVLEKRQSQPLYFASIMPGHARSSDTSCEPNVIDRAKVFMEIFEETQPHGIVYESLVRL
jgi:hypothetical protein